MKRVVILGSTGSIGTSTLSVIRNLGAEFQVLGLAAKSRIELLARQASDFQVQRLAIAEQADVADLRRCLNGYPVEILCGAEALARMAGDAEADIVVNALVGGIGLRATLTALQAGKIVALANKESIVMAGRLIIQAQQEYGGTLVPIDSEHSAVHQCLRGEDTREVKKLILTASGGPFLRRTSDSFQSITPEEALLHPNWQMGPKITVDSATLMNKGLEIIEAHYLFSLPPEAIEVVIHPQSVIHSLVEFVDGSIKAQLSLPDMRLPIQYALTYPERFVAHYTDTDLARIGSLEFETPDYDRFPCLKLAYEALRMGEGYPAVLSAANEVAVQAFLDKKLAFDRIPSVIEAALRDFSPPYISTIEDVIQVDRWARDYARTVIESKEI
jgi:1-deoxy-D-xylulose-5-phosphate reductoisomerase